VRGRSSARSAAVPARPELWPTSSSRRNVNAIRLRALSTPKTLTRTMSPGFTIERGSFTKVFAIAETCTKSAPCFACVRNAGVECRSIPPGDRRDTGIKRWSRLSAQKFRFAK
jgi:hypothetical protein